MIYKLALLSSLVLSAIVHADPVKVSSGNLSCQIEQFNSRESKTSYRACAALVDHKEIPVSGMEECKRRALEKAQACLKKVKAGEQVSVHGKFVEKLGVTSNSTSFTCELDQQGGVNCP